MPVPVALPSFAAGELSPALHGRVDLAKYQVGLATCLNWFIHPFGGASTRSGTAFVGEVFDSAARSRLIPFQFSTTQTYMLEFANQKMRVIYSGGYLLETAIAITAITNASPGVVTAAAHGLNDGDHVWLDGIVGMTQLNRRRFTVAGATANTFQISGIDTTAYTAWASAGTVARFYTIDTPYVTADLPLLKFVQSADTMTITHPSYAVRSLVHATAETFTLSTITFSSGVSPPTNVASNAVGTAEYYVMTSVNDTTGEESLQSTAAGSATAVSNISFVAVGGCSYYNVYKLKQGIYGFIGRVKEGSVFTDNTIIADTSDTPPTQKNPFGGYPLLSATINAAGAGYAGATLSIADPTGSSATVSATYTGPGGFSTITLPTKGSGYTNPTLTISGAGAGGSGAIFTINYTSGGTVIVGTDGDGNPVSTDWYYISSVTVNAGGAGYGTGSTVNTQYLGVTNYGGTILTPTIVLGVITAVAVTNAGSGQYADALGGFPAAFVNDAPGTGASITINLDTSLSNNPGCSTYFDGRQWFSRTNIRPQTLWASQSANFKNMSTSSPTRDSDAITRTIASREVNEIRFLLALNVLLLFTSGAIWKVWAGAQADVVTPANCAAKPQSYEGIANVPPIHTQSGGLYVVASGKAVRDVAYEYTSDNYQGRNLSILAGHLFEGQTIEEWAYARDPDGIVWSARSDGVLLGFTYLKEHDVYAWSRHTTDGTVESVAAVQESNETILYLSIKRTIGGVTKRYVERMASRYFPDIYAAWCVDSGYRYDGWNTTTTQLLTISGATYNAGDTVTLAATGYTPFTAASVGNKYILRSGQNQVTVTVTAYSTTSSVSATLDIAPHSSLQATTVSDWALATSTLSGLWHLEGRTVAILADGSVQPSSVVANGSITIPRASGRILAGLPYTCDFETLNIEQGQPTMQGRYKTVQEVVIRVKDTRGLAIGPDATRLVDVKERFDENYGYPTTLKTGDERVLLDPSWNSNGRVFVRQSYPLPATVVALFPRIDVGVQ